MVVNGCLLDEAYGDFHLKEKKKKNKKKENNNVAFDKDFKDSTGTSPNEESSPYYPVNSYYYKPSKPIEEPPSLEINNGDNNQDSEYNRRLTNKDYQDYLDFQRNRHNYIHQKDIIETFSTVNDNFNDVLIFALYGIIFLIFTDYIYKLGKKSY